MIINKREPWFLKPIFQENIWGGTALKDVFGYEINSEHTGECCGISAHLKGLSTIENGQFKGESLQSIWENHRELFGNLDGEKFPLIVKILDAKEDLSVQVHPDAAYAQLHENDEGGKTKCWYIIDCAEDAELILGHNAGSKEEATRWVSTGEWDRFLRRVKIRPGDFIYLPNGTVHAIGKGTLVLETQQNIEAAYRLYDFDRHDLNGNPRELHIEKALDVLTVPHVDTAQPKVEFALGDTTVTLLTQTEFFTMFKWEVTNEATFMQEDPFLNGSVIHGTGELICEAGTFPLKAGMHFILPNEFGEFTIKGNLDLIVSYVSI